MTMQRKGIQPTFRFGPYRSAGHTGYRKSLPFRRSWVAIGILAALTAVFLIPLISVFNQASSGWGNFDSLFDLVITLFLSAWMLGWSVAPIMMTLIILLMLFGREVIRTRAGVVELSIGLAGIGLISIYEMSKIQNLRLQTPAGKDRHSWRGPHLVFDYGATPVHFGSAIDAMGLSEVKSGLEAAGGELSGTDAAPAETLASDLKPNDPAQIPVALHDMAGFTEPITWSSPSSLALILANLVPIAGAFFLGWSLGDVMVLYWAESAVIGLFNLLKIIVIGRWTALFSGAFFLAHFGGFMSVHFLFIYTLFINNDMNPDQDGDLVKVAALFIALWPALAALFVSHGYSFFVNFLGRKEYRGRTMQKQMTEPYSRIIFMHMVLIFGGGLAMILQDPVPVLIIVIIVKIVVDLKSHIKERNPKPRETGIK